MKLTFKTYIIGLVAFYSFIIAITPLLRINDGAWSEVTRFIIIVWVMIPILSLVSGVFGSIMLKNLWIGATINFIGCFCTMIFLYSNPERTTSTDVLTCFWYSLVAFAITFFSATATHIIRKI